MLKSLYSNHVAIEILLLVGSSLFISFISIWRTKILHLLRTYVFGKKINFFAHYTISSISAIIGPSFFVILNGFVVLILQSLNWHVKIIDEVIKITIIFIIIKIISYLRQDGGSRLMIILIISISAIEYFGIDDIIRANIKGIKLNVLGLHISLYTVMSSMVQLLIMFWIISSITKIGKLFITLASKNEDSVNYTVHIKLFRYFSYFVGLILTLNIIGVDGHQIALVGSALGIGIGIGLQRIAANFISGIIMLTEKNIKIGDIVEIDGKFFARIKDLGIRSTIVETQDGKSIIIPNEEFMTKSITNVTRDNNSIRLNFAIITSDLLRLDDVVQVCIDATKCIVGVSKESKPTCYINNIVLRGAEILIYFWVNDLFKIDISSVKSKVIVSVVKKLSDHGIKVVMQDFEYKIIADTMDKLDSIPQESNK